MLKLLPTWKCVFITLCAAATFGVILMIAYYRAHFPKLIQQTNYLIEVDECEQDFSIYMLVLVGSHPNHVEIRNAIRETWGNRKLDKYRLKLVFLFGKVAKTSQQEQLWNEHNRYGDILEGDFVDSYHNVTVRDLMGLRWALQYCSHVRYILHADDDIALDIYKLISNLEKYYKKTVNLIACFDILIKTRPLRGGRYAVSVQEYPEDYYPDYCTGWAYVLTPTVAQQIVLAASSREILWINDVFITGTLIEDLSLKHKSLHLISTYQYSNMISFAQKYNISSEDKIIYELGPVMQNTTLLLQLHKIYKRRAIKNKFINDSDIF